MDCSCSVIALVSSTKSHKEISPTIMYSLTFAFSVSLSGWDFWADEIFWVHVDRSSFKQLSPNSFLNSLLHCLYMYLDLVVWNEFVGLFALFQKCQTLLALWCAAFRVGIPLWIVMLRVSFSGNCYCRDCRYLSWIRLTWVYVWWWDWVELDCQVLGKGSSNCSSPLEHVQGSCMSIYCMYLPGHVLYGITTGLKNGYAHTGA